MSKFNLKNKIAVIVGGASVNGIGFAIAEEFLRNDVKTVVLLDIADGIETGKRLNSKYGSDKAVFIKCDVTIDLDTISEKIFDKYKKVDILVNSAGIANEKSVRKNMEVNAIAVLEWSMKFYEHMKKEKEGTILNISSAYGYRIDHYGPFYKASKFAVVGFSGTLGHEINYMKSGVRVIVLCPGLTRTNMNQGGGKTNDSAWDELVKTAIWQDPDVVGRAAVHIFENAKSGTAWLIEEGKWSEIELCKTKK